jgi:hypothetical protein
MTPLLPPSSIARARRSPGRSSSALAALRGVHLDIACAPAVSWARENRGQNNISSIRVSTVRGEPRVRQLRFG